MANGSASSGRQVRITSGGYSAEISSVGATLRSLSYLGRQLTASFGADEVQPGALGACLLPWPNRIGGGTYEFAGSREQLAITEPARSNAIHGLAMWVDWDITALESDRVELSARIPAQPGYPHMLEATAAFSLSQRGLQWSIETVNAGRRPAPYGVATHPYLTLPRGRVDDWDLYVPAAEVLEVDEDSKLPRSLHPVTELNDGEFDFTARRTIGRARIDNALTGIRAADGPARVELTTAGPDPIGVSLSWDPQVMPWVQIFTADLPDQPGLDRSALAVEAMTCPPDAFNSGTDLVILDPGQNHCATWSIAAIGSRS
jgi:aldose 1-epimerase